MRARLLVSGLLAAILCHGPAAAGANCPPDSARVAAADMARLMPRVAELTGLPWDGSLPTVYPVTLDWLRGIAGVPPDAAALYWARAIYYRCRPWLNLPLLAHELCHHLQWTAAGDPRRTWTRATGDEREATCLAVQAAFAGSATGR